MPDTNGSVGPVADSLSALSSMLLAEETLDSVLQQVVKLTCSSISGCAHAGVTLVRDDKAVTAAATDSIANDVDGVQYATGQGPCLQAIRENRIFRIEDMAADSTFPEFCRQARRFGVASSLSFPLAARSQVIGALNLYADKPNAFDLTNEQMGERFARQAAVALANAQVHDQTVQLVGHLNTALSSRAVIDQAKGILMARQGCTADAAFDILRRASQGRNRKLREIAEEIVRSVSAPQGERAESSPV